MQWPPARGIVVADPSCRQKLHWCRGKEEKLPNIPKSFPKIIIPSILSTKPTLSVTRGPIPTVGDHGGPHQSPKTTIYTPENYHFCSPGLPIPVLLASIPPTTVEGRFVLFLPTASIRLKAFIWFIRRYSSKSYWQASQYFQEQYCFSSMFLPMYNSSIAFWRRLNQ